LLAVTPRVFPPLDHAAEKLFDQLRLARDHFAGHRQADIGKANLFFGVTEHMALGLFQLREISGTQRDRVNAAGLQRSQALGAKTHRHISNRIGIDAIFA
jgi:hypothetical protein